MRPWSRWAPVAGAGLLAAGMLAALFPSSPQSGAPAPAPPPKSVTTERPPPAKPKIALTTGITTGGPNKVEGTVRQGPGPDGRIWDAIDDRGHVTVNGEGLRWVAFWAGSYAQPRRMTVRGDDQESGAAAVSTAPRPLLFGPFKVDGSKRLSIRGSPPSRPPEAGAPSVAFFVSEALTTSVPAAVLPGRGFWQTQYEAERRLVWLRDYGTMTVVARSRVKEMWIRFRASALAPQRLVARVTRPHAGVLLRAQVRPGAQQTFEIGPIRLEGGTADVRFDALPGALRAGPKDPREVSVLFTAFDAALALTR